MAGGTGPGCDPMSCATARCTVPRGVMYLGDTVPLGLGVLAGGLGVRRGLGREAGSSN